MSICMGRSYLLNFLQHFILITLFYLTEFQHEAESTTNLETILAIFKDFC